MGYGAVVPDGYGCSYNLQQDFVIFCIGSFFSCEETSSLLYAEALEESMDQMKEMFSNKEWNECIYQFAIEYKSMRKSTIATVVQIKLQFYR